MADTNITSQITRIEEARNLIRDILGPTTGSWTGESVDTSGKKTEWGPWGLGDGTEKIDDLAEILSNVVNRGTPSLEVVEGKSIDLPRGFYMGGSIQGLSDTAGDENKYRTQTKSATPSKSAITLSPDSGYYALSSVTIEPIPAKYQDVSATTAVAANVLSGKKFTAADGTVITGTMKDNTGIGSLIIGNPTPTSITYPESGTAQKAILISGFYPDNHAFINTQQKTITPTELRQVIHPDVDYWLGEVIVNPIPANYITTTDATATAAQILSGKTAYVDGSKITGTMADKSGTAVKLTTWTNEDIANAIKDTGYGTLYNNFSASGYYDTTSKIEVPIENLVVTPAKTAKEFYGGGYLYGRVYVNAIPAEYITTTDATAVAANILSGKTAYVNGSKITGTMADESGTTMKFMTMCDTYSYAGPGNPRYDSTETVAFTIPTGYHDGTSKCSLTLGKITITPTKLTQTIDAPDDTAIGRVVVNAIPAAYQDVSATTASAATVLSGYKFTNTSGTVVTGTMANNGATSKTFNPLTETSVSIAAGYTTGGSVTLTADLENRLAAI